MYLNNSRVSCEYGNTREYEVFVVDFFLSEAQWSSMRYISVLYLDQDDMS